MTVNVWKTAKALILSVSRNYQFNVFSSDFSHLVSKQWTINKINSMFGEKWWLMVLDFWQTQKIFVQFSSVQSFIPVMLNLSWPKELIKNYHKQMLKQFSFYPVEYKIFNLKNVLLDMSSIKHIFAKLFRQSSIC